MGPENLTQHTRNARCRSHIISDEYYTFKVAESLDIKGVAPLLCAGEWRGLHQRQLVSFVACTRGSW